VLEFPDVICRNVLVIQSIHTCHTRWSQKGVWQKIFEALSKDADHEYAMIDSTIVRAHQQSAGAKKKDEAQAIGRSTGGLSTKIHATLRCSWEPPLAFT